MSENVITGKKIYKIFKLGEERVIALNGVSLEVKKGEFVAIVGTSGSGKSTLLNMLAGLDRPTRGEIIVAGRHIERMSEGDLVKFRREHVGFIFQAYDLLPQFDAIENVALPLSFKGMDKQRRRKEAVRYLKKMGLEKYMKHRPTEMSGGQQQRVGIARALAVRPEIIFADEPTGNLDTKTTIEVLHILQEVVHKDGNTLVMVTHDKHLADYADRRIHILDGEIVLED
ncbi:MAG: ABC transporter ATP-binding protein [Lachnospiraceae bacterium]|nr:ABC transporter ATP-binding protein [Lachnospiraceae bacterium]MBQ9607524.1 ABC transporter ATP-binding protein [Lachnospiraceae bacterium]MBR1523434.1 ABC transporter ATP-binding protein [Lachnospiraceae bacterium]